MTNEITQFKYEQLDESTADFLRQKESNMRQIVGKAYTELGKELKEARDRLAGNNQYDGVFMRWYQSIGFKKDVVSRLINRYELFAKSEDQTRELLEDLPVSLTYEIARPSAEATPEKAQAKTEVLAGDIATLKEYRERIKELEKKAEAEQAERERLERENEALANKEPEVVVKTEYIEVRDEYTEQRAEQAEKRLKQYEEKFGDIRNYDESITATHVQDMISATMSFKRAVKEFARRFSYMTKYKDAINRMDHISKQEYNEAVKALHELADSFEYLDEDNERIIINQ